MDNGIMNVSCCWSVIPNFKIRKKADIKVFMQKVMGTNSSYVFKADDKVYEITRSNSDKYTFLSVNYAGCIGIGLTLADTDSSVYDMTFEDCVWKYRKYINAHFFRD